MHLPTHIHAYDIFHGRVHGTDDARWHRTWTCPSWVCTPCSSSSESFRNGPTVRRLCPLRGPRVRTTAAAADQTRAATDPLWTTRSPRRMVKGAITRAVAMAGMPVTVKVRDAGARQMTWTSLRSSILTAFLSWLQEWARLISPSVIRLSCVGLSSAAFNGHDTEGGALHRLAQ
jgi:hypothetical protein